MAKYSKLLPADWTFVRVADVAFLNSESLSDSTSKNLKFRYVDLSCVQKGHIDLPAEPITFADAPCRARRVAKKNDIVMATVRPYLQGFARLDLEAEDIVFSTGFAILRPHDHDDSEFIYQTLYSNVISKQFHALLVGTNYPALNSDDIGKLRIPYPLDKTERTRIGNILACFDGSIKSVKRLISAKLRLKRGLMQQLLTGKRRFGEFDEPWQSCSIRDTMKVASRHVSVEKDSIYRLVSIRRRSGGFFDRDLLRGKEIGYGRLNVIKSGDFVIARRQVIHGAMAMAGDDVDGAFVSDSYAILVPKEPQRLYMPFFDHLSRMAFMYYKAWRCSYGVAREKLFFNLKWFLDEEIALPSTVEEQHKIARVLSAADNEINLLRRKLELLKKQKRGLMQKLLTGKVRVKV